jgi:adenylate kinase
LLQDKFNIPKISTGDILRAAVEEGAKLGQQAKKFMDKGELVADEVVISLIKKRIVEPDCEAGYILDGFPRTIVQAEKLGETLAAMGKDIDSVVDLEVEPEELLVRLTGRRTCKNCGTMFHQTSHPPKVEDVCDECGGELYQRPDDNKETIVKRLEIYERETAPLKEFYRKQGKIKTIQGYGGMDKIFSELCKMVS